MSSRQSAIREWLNSARDYSTGAALFSVYGDRQQLKNLFAHNKTPYTEKRLLEEMERLYDSFSSAQTETPEALPEIETVTKPKEPAIIQALPGTIENTELEQACDTRAKQLYKSMMNDRAVLFNLARGDDSTHLPDQVEKRRVLALQVCAANYEVSKAYEDLEHVRLHGCLPSVETTEKLSFADIPDSQVKFSIDNIRKNISKLRKRGLTPERIALIQTHEVNLKPLLKRWDSLK